MTEPSDAQGLVDGLLREVVLWASKREDVLGVALVGSHARGEAAQGSDVDLVLVLRRVEPLFADDRWLAKFGQPTSIEHEDHGIVRSRRVRYARGLEVEWGLTDARWCVVDPLDPGTAKVVASGMRVLHDPNGIVAALAAAVGRVSGPP